MRGGDVGRRWTLAREKDCWPSRGAVGGRSNDIDRSIHTVVLVSITAQVCWDELQGAVLCIYQRSVGALRLRFNAHSRLLLLVHSGT